MEDLLGFIVLPWILTAIAIVSVPLAILTLTIQLVTRWSLMTTSERMTRVILLSVFTVTAVVLFPAFYGVFS